MKILFVADIHINLRHKKVPKEWARKRYEILFDELTRVYDDYGCELEIHGGDVFDKLPTLEELEIYYSYIRGDKPLIIFDGNHEATKKGHTFFHIIKDTIENQNKYAEVLVEPCGRYGIDFIPYTHLKTFDVDSVKFSDMLCTHVRGEIPPHVTPEVDLDKFKDWKLVLAGDLHSHSNSQKNIVYPGSPVSVSFHRNKIETGVLVVDSDTLKWEWVKLKVPQLYRKTVDKPEDMVSTHFDFTIYELTGDIVELSKVSGENSLLDKKVFNYKMFLFESLSELCTWGIT
jgi:DNA repair exonuclease SbcCD nuclease subunit